MATFHIIGGDQKQYGPVAAEELGQWVAEGRLNEHSLVLAAGAAEWKPLAAFPEFAAALQPQRTGRAPGVAAAATPAEWSNSILAREPELRIGECLGSGFGFLFANPGLVLGSVCVVMILRGIMMFTPFIGGILHWVLSGVLMGGLYLVCLRRLRGGIASVANVFDGFKSGFVQLMLTGLLTSLLEGIGVLFCGLPWVYLTVAWKFALPLTADKRLEFWSAMELSRKVVTRVWFEVFLVLFVTFLPVLLFQAFTIVKIFGLVFGMMQEANFDPLRLATAMQSHLSELVKTSILLGLGGQVILVLNQFFAVGVIVRAYENLFGPRKA